jgi:hypothetical protein
MKNIKTTIMEMVLESSKAISKEYLPTSKQAEIDLELYTYAVYLHALELIQQDSLFTEEFKNDAKIAFERFTAKPGVLELYLYFGPSLSKESAMEKISIYLNEVRKVMGNQELVPQVAFEIFSAYPRFNELPEDQKSIEYFQKVYKEYLFGAIEKFMSVAPRLNEIAEDIEMQLAFEHMEAFVSFQYYSSMESLRAFFSNKLSEKGEMELRFFLHQFFSEVLAGQMDETQKGNLMGTILEHIHADYFTQATPENNFFSLREMLYPLCLKKYIKKNDPSLLLGFLESLLMKDIYLIENETDNPDYRKEIFRKKILGLLDEVLGELVFMAFEDSIGTI